MFTVIHQSLQNTIDLSWHLAPVNHAMLFHQKIYQAIRQADPSDARTQMTNHLREVQELLTRANNENKTSLLDRRITESGIRSAAPVKPKS